MTDSNTPRITSLADLAQHRDVIETRPSVYIDPLQTNVGYQKRHNNGQQRQPRQQQQAQHMDTRMQESRTQERAVHHQEQRANRPSVDEVAKLIKQRVKRPEGSLPYLEDFIMELQDHRFTFTFPNPNELKKFIEAEIAEHRFHQIAWAGGDEYMAAYMMYKKYAMEDIVQARVQTAVEKTKKALMKKFEATATAVQATATEGAEVVAANEADVTSNVDVA